MADCDAIMRQIDAAVDLRFRGDRNSARRSLFEIWEEINPTGNPIQLCIIAHHLADLQEDGKSELAWDLRALEAANLVTDADQTSLPLIPIETVYPSLHVNLGDDYRKLGDTAKAREHLTKARDCLHRCEGVVAMGPDDEYGKLIRSGVQRLADLLDGKAQ